ncbi:MAG: Uma2 family endonuclease [Myxacorys chilensis ATA2-1-KO14]|jgi:Uma2 family endonuclease|nr:Uma2 family endonuclease [Myxacorys chilensis ATA2-1-KO14]
MTQAKPRFSTFEEYLTYDDADNSRYELIDGELVELPPESEPNDWIALNLRDVLIQLVNRRLVRLHNCEIQVPVLKKGDAQNRYPDLVVLREEHLALTQKRLTIKLDMPPPQLVMEVVSPGRQNRERDYERKRDQYCRIGIPEYWIINPEQKTVLVLTLEGDVYVEVGQFRGNSPIISPLFSNLAIAPEQVFE